MKPISKKVWIFALLGGLAFALALVAADFDYEQPLPNSIFQPSSNGLSSEKSKPSNYISIPEDPVADSHQGGEEKGRMAPSIGQVAWMLAGVGSLMMLAALCLYIIG